MTSLRSLEKMVERLERSRQTAPAFLAKVDPVDLALARAHYCRFTPLAVALSETRTTKELVTTKGLRPLSLALAYPPGEQLPTEITKELESGGRLARESDDEIRRSYNGHVPGFVLDHRDTSRATLALMDDAQATPLRDYAWRRRGSKWIVAPSVERAARIQNVPPSELDGLASTYACAHPISDAVERGEIPARQTGVMRTGRPLLHVSYADAAAFIRQMESPV